MALTLEQYIDYLDSQRRSFPAPPIVDPLRAKPHLVRLADVRVVTWNVYGTLLAISGGELYFEHPQRGMMDLALEKVIQEFKMWASMTRKPGPPTEQLRSLYEQVLNQQRTVPSGVEKHPEVGADRLWEEIVKKLLQKEYKFDAGSYGSLNEFSRKVAYFFHAGMQGVACYPGAAAALTHVVDSGRCQAVLGNGQCFTLGQLQRCLRQQDSGIDLSKVIDLALSTLSYEIRAKQPSDKLYRRTLTVAAERGIRPEQVLHIGSRISLDVVPAKRLGMKTGLFAGDRTSLEATSKQLENRQNRPDVLLTELEQIAEVVPRNE